MKVIPYKQIDGIELVCHIFEPADSDERARPCALLIHGGGWVNGGPEKYHAHAERLTRQGLVACSIAYRLAKEDRSVDDCIRDARSAMRFLRSHAAELGIDPDRIVVVGGSAGAHLAIGCALFDGCDEASDDLAVSCMPQAAVLFNPVTDCSAEGYGHAKLGESWRERSPLHQVRPGLPPTIVFASRKDRTTPFIGAERFVAAMHDAGNVCAFHPSEEGDHGYYLAEPVFSQVFEAIDAFLREHLPDER